MKKIFIMMAACATVVACSTKPAKTIENLKVAANNEATASANYAKYAEQALAEGDTNIAYMFQATSFAESRHSAQHIAELAKLGVADYTPVIAEEEVGTTADNLTKAIAQEETEFNQMYPEYIKVAQDEKAQGAQTSFEWACKAEEKHAGFYREALEALNNGGDSTFKVTFVVCNKCGNTYKAGEEPEACELCGSTKDQYTAFSAQPVAEQPAEAEVAEAEATTENATATEKK